MSILTAEPLDADPERDAIAAMLRVADPAGLRFGKVFRDTFDQLYDGQRTGRYRWDQLFKTEKTHYGTLLEINLRREFDDVIDDGVVLDYRMLGHDIDCKYSQTEAAWMLPPESFDRLVLGCTASDTNSTWSVGIVRVEEANRRLSQNRDAKTQLNTRGKAQIAWLFRDAELPPNVLLHLSEETIAAVFAPRSGQARINELLRRVTNQRIGRSVIAAVAQQSDYMARLRDNGGGARTVLRREGYLIPGDYEVHRAVARQLEMSVPQAGEVVSFRVVPADRGDWPTVVLSGRYWRVARPEEPSTEQAPRLPTTVRPARSESD